MHSFELKFMIEKREGKGEDSPPFSLKTMQGLNVVGVFDGMGGAGATACKSDFGDSHTKAYVASRIISEVIETEIGKSDDITISSDWLERICIERLKREVEKYPCEKSVLKSSLLREYPTTLAIITVRKEDKEDENSNWIIDSYWAGDSRNYLWTQEGLCQISKDDIIGDSDPLENLRNDAALSNCICADRLFHINHLEIKLESHEPFVIFSATDGCFGYMPTPMHFESIIKKSLEESTDVDKWKDALIKEISKITGDDFSFALQVFNCENYNDVKLLVKHNTNGTQIINKKIKDKHRLEKKYIARIERADEELKETIEREWKKYKKSYLKYL